ncbi:MAG: tetratricopeptide repeat protein, partial [Anaerolineaceae bacterium]|nr:tetratricopeptide repeat protein [Anaerolineaceae bacterium]
MGQINRTQIITLSNAAYQLEQFGESKKILVAWLHKYPNDLWIRYRLAIILYKLGEFEKAIRLSEMIVAEDPEFYEVWGLLAVLYPDLSNDRKLAEYRARKLQSDDEKGKKKGFKALFGKTREAKQDDIVVENDEFDILTAVNNAKLLLNDDDRVSSCRILSIYHKRWQQTIQFRLIFGHILNQMQRDDEGMGIIQSAVDADITGQVGERIWPQDNPYKNLWADPDSLM